MTRASIKRIGVVVKPHQPDALDTLCRLTAWLDQRGIALVGGPEIERERVEHETGCVIASVPQAEIARGVDLMLVLGGDGTMIATARMLGDIEVPVIGVNYGGLGYLAEFATGGGGVLMVT
ncbi:MAG: NAD(+)/NADH kinase, partial [Acidobacteriota bacterium]